MLLLIILSLVILLVSCKIKLLLDSAMIEGEIKEVWKLLTARDVVKMLMELDCNSIDCSEN